MEPMEGATTVERMLLDRAKRTRTPANGSIELLPLCNMNCDMCYVRLSREEMECQGRLKTADEWLEIGRQMQRSGVLFLLLLDNIIPHLHLGSDTPEGIKSPISRSAKLVLAVTLHNIPEGMAVGVVYAALLSGGTDITVTGALALSLGIAIQNFPEGAIISMPLHSRGTGKMKSFIGGALSGIVEPLGAVITILAASFVTPILPYLLSFAAGAMIYVVVEELIPEMSIGKHSNTGTLCFALGFTLMLALDVALG